MPPTYINFYYCSKGGHYVRQEQANFINSVPYCPECKKKLRTKRKTNKRFIKRTNKSILSELLKSGVPYRTEFNLKCMCSFCKINYNLFKRLKRFKSTRTISQAQKERIRPKRLQMIEVKV